MSTFETNEVVQILGISVPIIQGGMAWSSEAGLASAVSNAGALGVIGCGGRTLQWTRLQIEQAMRNTSNPIGINIPLESLSDEEADAIIKLAIRLNVKVITLSGSRGYLKYLTNNQSSTVIIPIVGNVMEAKLCERAGAKAVICEGQESGGSIGRLSTMSLVPQVADAVSVPVIAAGGIADNRGFRAAFALGAKAIQMGTRFLASEECEIIQSYKQRIIKAKDIDSVVVFERIGRPARVIRNRFANIYLEKERSGADAESLLALSRGSLQKAAQADCDEGALMAGEVSGLIREIKPVDNIIREVIGEGAAAPRELPNHFFGLRHQPPILLVDHVTSLEPGRSCTATLNLDRNRWFFECHYPDYPLMPGSLQIEAMSQVATIVALTLSKEHEHKPPLISEITKAKFLEEIRPENKLTMKATVKTASRGLVTISCQSEIGQRIMSMCEIRLVLPSFATGNPHPSQGV